MSERIIVITGHFPKYDRYNKPVRDSFGNPIVEFGSSHGVGECTGNNYILPFQHPSSLGAKYDHSLGEWVIDD